MATVVVPVVLGWPGTPVEYEASNDSGQAQPTQVAEVLLSGAGHAVLPLPELAGVELPGLRVSDLVAVPGVPPPADAASLPLGSSGFVAAGVAPETPALTPGLVAADMQSRVGVRVDEVARDTPFSMVALTSRDLEGTTALVRARRPDGGWGAWYEAGTGDTIGAHRPQNARPQGTEPIYVGRTTAVQILATQEPGAVAVGPQYPAPPAAKLSAVLLEPGSGASASPVAAPLPGGGPTVITRDQWGADESLRCEEPVYDDMLGGVVVHHTAGRNDYSREESAGIVRAIYTYHAQTLGWCDIGYNALVDRYGQIFEGRFGGLDRAVQGAHTGGFNENTAGVALMGNHEAEAPTEEAITALGRFIGWRTAIAGLDPQASTTMWSEGTEFTRYAQGQEVRLPVVFSHRDVGDTTCAGDAAYAMMDRIRELAASAAAPRSSSGTAPVLPDPSAVPSPSVSPGPGSDLAGLAVLTARMLELVEESALARHWVDAGGPDGRLGQAVSEPTPAAGGGQYARFVHGYLFQALDGQVFEVAGRLGERFAELGGDTGVLGAPVSGEYPVPGGVRVDFGNGSLILDQATEAVTTLTTFPAAPPPEPVPDQVPPGAAPGDGSPELP
ncbi:N-acetylmuramoyl-L-alanine amidase [Nocardia cyriacigeorgica]|uniref:N-acetylmuramoyl-L-alanine amidase n=1 Tax=Nocardia cyriacigeorgica TaxID=135487 RepID=UPI002455EA56|nr:N-acetylmuramoyl-L-alanine amidase [Nocardia cyriacigeorgica]